MSKFGYYSYNNNENNNKNGGYNIQGYYNEGYSSEIYLNEEYSHDYYLNNYNNHNQSYNSYNSHNHYHHHDQIISNHNNNNNINNNDIINYVYEVRFKCTKDSYRLCETCQNDLLIGDTVIVETDRGYDAGVVNSIQPLNVPSSPFLPHPMSTLRRILSRASEDDLVMIQQNYREEERALQLCRHLALMRHLPITIAATEMQFDRKKLTIIFSADRRVDFRELVRDMFQMFKTRIWMQKVSPAEASALALIYPTAPLTPDTPIIYPHTRSLVSLPVVSTSEDSENYNSQDNELVPINNSSSSMNQPYNGNNNNNGGTSQRRNSYRKQSRSSSEDSNAEYYATPPPPPTSSHDSSPYPNNSNFKIINSRVDSNSNNSYNSHHDGYNHNQLDNFKTSNYGIPPNHRGNQSMNINTNGVQIKSIQSQNIDGQYYSQSQIQLQNNFRQHQHEYDLNKRSQENYPQSIPTTTTTTTTVTSTSISISKSKQSKSPQERSLQNQTPSPTSDDMMNQKNMNNNHHIINDQNYYESNHRRE